MHTQAHWLIAAEDAARALTRALDRLLAQPALEARRGVAPGHQHLPIRQLRPLPLPRRPRLIRRARNSCRANLQNMYPTEIL